MAPYDPPFFTLRRRLIDAGLPPRRARRVTRELADHHADLLDELAAQGITGEEAARAARSRLGAPDDLEREILARDTSRSFVKCYPALAFPLGLPALAALLVAVTLMGVLGLDEGLKTIGLGNQGVSFALAEGHYVFAGYLLVPLLSLYAGWTARDHHLAWYWPLCAALVLAVAGGLLFQVTLTPPIPGQAGSGSYEIGFHMAGGLHVQSLWRLLTPLLAITPMVLWKGGRAGAPA
jgi:hypothetical protein